MPYLFIEMTGMIYPSQRSIAENIFNKVITNPNKFIGLLVGLTQAGKTGVISAIVDTIKQNEKKDNFLFTIDDVFVCTGLSSTDWKNQTKDRIDEIANNIYHRPDILKGMLKKLKDKENIILIIDEVHIASKGDQTLDRFFQMIDLEGMDKTKIKLIYISATPACVLKDVLSIKDDVCEVFRMEMVEGYVGTERLLQENRIKKSIEYKKWENAHTLSLYVDLVSFKDPKYHIFRVTETRKPKTTKKDNSADSGTDKASVKEEQPIVKDDRTTILEIFQTARITPRVIEYNECDKDAVKRDVNSFLNTPPSRHTIIFVKEKLRCSISINKDHLGILYERIPTSGVKGNISVFIQGLVGRMCGYNDNGVSICYTNLDIVQQYNDAWKEDNMNAIKDLFEPEIKKTVTFTSGDRIGLEVAVADADNSKKADKTDEVHRIIFKSYDEMNVWILANLKGSKRKRVKQRDERGFAITPFRNSKHIMDWNIVDKFKGSGLSFEKKTSRYFVVYDDLNDITTDNHVLYYKNN